MVAQSAHFDRKMEALNVLWLKIWRNHLQGKDLILARPENDLRKDLPRATPRGEVINLMKCSNYTLTPFPLFLTPFPDKN